MKNFVTAAMMALLFSSAPLLAHSDHGGVGTSRVKSIAIDWVTKMQFRDYGHASGKLDGSWKNASERNAKLLADKKDHFLVAVENPASKKTLLITIAKDGGLIDAVFK